MDSADSRGNKIWLNRLAWLTFITAVSFRPRVRAKDFPIASACIWVGQFTHNDGQNTCWKFVPKSHERILYTSTDQVLLSQLLSWNPFMDQTRNGCNCREKMSGGGGGMYLYRYQLRPCGPRGTTVRVRVICHFFFVSRFKKKNFQIHFSPRGFFSLFIFVASSGYTLGWLFFWFVCTICLHSLFSWSANTTVHGLGGMGAMVMALVNTTTVILSRFETYFW